jgi:acetolactate synthase-1/2/3 large subunit
VSGWTSPARPGPVDRTVAGALLETLRLEGVDHVFGVPGGALAPVLVELKSDKEITYVVCRHEGGAAYVADGYARTRDGLGVVIVTSGPGATNALTGTLNADSSGTPFLVITGEVATSYYGRGYLQEGVDAPLDVAAVYRAATGWSEVVGSAADFPDLLFAALRIARGGPNRAAHLSIPVDIAGQPVPGYTPPPTPWSYRAPPAAVDRAGIEEAVAAIAAAHRPLLMLGDGCRAALRDPVALDHLVNAVETLSVPVVTEPDAKGLFPETHPLALRNYGIAACAWPKYYMCQVTAGGARVQYDTLVTIGAPLGDLATRGSSPYDPLLVPDGPFIQIDDDQAVIGRAFPITRGVVGDMRGALQTFTEIAARTTVDPAVARARRELVDAIKAGHDPSEPAIGPASADRVAPQQLITTIGEILPAGSHIWVDGGNCIGWCLNGLVVDPPSQAHLALAMGCTGFGVGAVVGGKLADPSATHLAVVGDGGFLMHIGEVATAAQYRLGAIWVVLADHDLAMVSQGMAAQTRDPSFRDYYKVGWSDLATAAQGLGAHAVTVHTLAATREALRHAVHAARDGTPQVLVVDIDRDAVPPYFPPRYPPLDDGAGPGR